MRIRCDLFCKVVDNFGDAAVCWRLARQLVREQGWQVRLWIDALAPLALLQPDCLPLLECQVVDEVEIRHWPDHFPAAEPGDVVIEAFACELPASFVDAMARREQRPVWVNLEYLSAEDWVVGCHGLSSPHPTLPLVKFFFFPGFVAGTGGLIREQAFAIPAPTPKGEALHVSLFCYQNTALPRLLDQWRADSRPLYCHITEGWARTQVESWLNQSFQPGQSVQLGQLTLEALPFLPQDRYDSLLAKCDLNFVRGEDSFVRAQWVELPLVWQIYPQTDAAHVKKLDAFLNSYGQRVSCEAGAALRDFWYVWNGVAEGSLDWGAFRASLPVLRSHARQWAEQLSTLGQVAENLAKFCAERI